MLSASAAQVMGGRFRSVMPSNLAKVGAIARESLPAAGVEYASDANRRELLRMYRRWGEGGPLARTLHSYRCRPCSG